MTVPATSSRPLGRCMQLREGAIPPSRGQLRHALFDFDGTLSLLRAGWQQVMTAYFDEVLAAAGDEDSATRRSVCVDFITRLTGRQTIYQCMELAEQVVARGGQALPPEEYKAEYLRRLDLHIAHRSEAISNGNDPTGYLVPGTHELLAGLVSRGIRCYLASGTDVIYVRQEAALLGLERYFIDPGEAPRIYGALDDYRKFSKRMVIEQMLAETDMTGSALVGFGDGYVEIEETLRAGGFAVGIASDETRVDDRGRDAPELDRWKEKRLWDVGAHVITPHWLERDVLFACLGLDSD